MGSDGKAPATARAVPGTLHRERTPRYDNGVTAAAPEVLIQDRIRRFTWRLTLGQCPDTARSDGRLPRAAELCRCQVPGVSTAIGAALKTRLILRNGLGGNVELSPDDEGRLWAEFDLDPAVLLRADGTDGSGGRI